MEEAVMRGGPFFAYRSPSLLWISRLMKKKWTRESMDEVRTQSARSRPKAANITAAATKLKIDETHEKTKYKSATQNQAPI